MKKIKDPISALTHFIGVILSAFATYAMVNKASELGNIFHVLPFLIFGVSLILLYLASTIYHIVENPKFLADVLHRIDHIMIFILIAGTYTPICLIPLKGTLGITILSIIWVIAIAGIFLKIFWMSAPRWLYTGIYILAGWIIILAIIPLSQVLSSEAIFWLVTGGVVYTLGAVIYATKWSKLSFKHFGFHEIFHLFVLGGSFCHFLMIYNYIMYL
jgi:hemolysin III